MTFRQIEFFIAVCEEGSFSKASSRLLISQQAISKAIRELEEELGVPLLKRTSGGVTLTNYGTYAHEECLRILQKKDYMVSHILQMKSAPKEPLVVGMSYGVIAALPPTFLEDFAKKYPQFQLEYEDHSDRRLVDIYRQEQYDLILTIGPLDRTDSNVELIKRERVFLCIPYTHPLAKADPQFLTMEELKDYPFVMFDHHFNMGDNFRASCRHAGFEPKILLSSGDFNSLVELAVHTNSLFIVPEHTIRPMDAHLKYLPFPDPRFTWDILFATRKSKILTEGIVSFREFLKASVAEMH